MATNVFELVCFNRYRQARLVLEAGGDPNFRNNCGETPLMACAMYIREAERRTQLMRMLIDFGGDVNAQNDKGQTMMMYACILDQVDTLLLLIGRRNIDLDICDVAGNTCLMYACALDRAALVFVLLDGHQTGRHKINIYHRNHEGQSAREIAHRRGYFHITDLFAESMDRDYWSTYNQLSRETDEPKYRKYPLEIEGSDSVQPLSSMVERILHVSKGSTSTNTEEMNLTLQHGAGESCNNAVENVDARDDTSGISEQTETAEGTFLESLIDSVVLQSNVSKGNNKHRDPSINSSNITRSINSAVTSQKYPVGSANIGGDTRNVTEMNCSNMVPSPNSSRNPIAEKLNYYSRHDAQEKDEVKPPINKTPRPPTRTKSRARRRKTTEVFVTVADGKIVPYRNKQNGGNLSDSYSCTENDVVNSISETHTQLHAPSPAPNSTRLPSRSNQRVDRRLERVAMTGNSLVIEQSESLEQYYPQSVSKGPQSNYRIGSQQYYLNNNPPVFDNVATSYQSAPRTYINLENQTTRLEKNGGLNRSASFRQSSRKAGSFRTVAW